MGTIIICILILLLAVFSIKSYCKKLSQGCCGAEGDGTEKRLCKKKTAQQADWYTFELGIEGMVCKNCAIRVENAFNRLDDVWAKVNLSNHTALVQTKEKLPETQLRAIVREAGYRVTSISEK